MIPPLTTTLDELRSEIRGQITNAYYDCRNEGETMETAADRAADSVMEVLAAQPAPPAEALRLLRELYDRTLLRNEARLKSDWLRIRGGPEQEENEGIERLRVAARLQEKTLAEAHRFLAATEEGTP